MGISGTKEHSSNRRQKKNAHVIVCGNEKGGSGKTTTSMHVVVSLLKSGFKVATIDLDIRQQSLTRYIQNRKNWSDAKGLFLELPNHFRFDSADLDSMKENQSMDFSSLAAAITEVQHNHDFVVIDTPGSDNYLMRLSHSMADTLITPMNDSFVDFDVLGHINPHSMEVSSISHYASMIRDSRRQRRSTDGGLIDWVVVRNRLSTLNSRNKSKLMQSVRDMSMQLGFRVADGISERVIFREYFPMGLTALDELEILQIDGRSSASHTAARLEISKLMRSLRLPIDQKAQKRSEARKYWLKTAGNLLNLDDVAAQ